MAFTPKTAPYSGKINAVTLGTGDKAVVIGGQNVMPFYTFDAPIENAPKIGVEISDLADSWTAPALKEFLCRLHHHGGLRQEGGDHARCGLPVPAL